MPDFLEVNIYLTNALPANDLRVTMARVSPPTTASHIKFLLCHRKRQRCKDVTISTAFSSYAVLILQDPSYAEFASYGIAGKSCEIREPGQNDKANYAVVQPI